MRITNNYIWKAKRARTLTFGRLSWAIVAAFWAVFALSVVTATGQARRTVPLGNSELGRENLSRVAAPAGQIKLVLLKDPGLLVELKGWVAKDSTDHGQIIGDADLTNDAIFRRLEEDVPFRAVATRLLQKYGYLVPTVNPDSELGKEQALLTQERVKWVVQQEEEERAQAHSQAQQKLQFARDCQRGIESACTSLGIQLGNTEVAKLSAGAAQAPPEADLGEGPPPAEPRRGANLQPGAPLMQTSAESSGDYAQLLAGTLGGFEPGAESAAGAWISESPQPMAGRRDGGTSISARRENFETEGGVTTGSPYGTRFEGSPDGPEFGFLESADFNANDAAARVPQGIPGPGASSVLSRRVQPNAARQPAELVRKPGPYQDVPSIYEMYMQAVERPATPRRFGIDVFTNGSRVAQRFPMDLPAGPDYVVGPGDGLSFEMWGSVSRRLLRTVDREGRVSLPEVGPILVSGKTLGDVQQNVQQILRTQFRDVSADVSLARLRTIRVYEVGDLVNPGAYDISSLSTPLNALFAAGGPTARGSLRVVKHYRGGHLVQEVDVYDLLLHGVKANLERLENGDTILAPPIGPQVTVEGLVRRPAIYELRGERTLASVLELAGGVLPTAALRHIEVERVVEHEKRTMLSVNVAAGSDAAQTEKTLEAFEIRDGDRIRIFPLAPYNQDAIYLEGHVLRPGRYSYRKEMRLTDVIASYADLLPEPATDYAEIIRLNAPDFHPSVESFDLAAALENPVQAPTLQAMDTVRIFSRFDFANPPAVSVWGDVRRPGTYRTVGQVRLSDAVHLAGGLAPDALTEDAQVFRPLAGGKMKILNVRLAEALAGGTSENILLEPRDRLLIHRSPEAVEAPTVSVQGEVGKPGRYPLTANMRVADLIRSGGGLKPSADAETADLTHFSWSNSAAPLVSQHEIVAIPRARAGDPAADVELHNGDVLTVRQIAGWNDLGASITVKGEVKHPGIYGIRPGERLSSVLARAGGFQPQAYPYGAIFERVQVRELEQRAQDEMILRVKSLESNLVLLPDGDARQKQAKEAALEQYRGTLNQLASNPPAGRVAIRISSRFENWKNGSADVEVRAGDTLVIPKKPGYVMVTGQVFNPTAVSFRPGHSAQWYLGQAGGPTQMANKRAIFVVRADGSVTGTKNSAWSGNSLHAVLEPGDTVVVPEKAIGGGIQWQNIFTAVQVSSSVASTVFIAMHY